MLIDEAKIYICSGNGGDGLVSFRREKYVSHGGPNGGDGGRGGDIIIRVNPKYNSLVFFQRKNRFKAQHGARGGSSNKTGADASPTVVEVPPGTIVRHADTGTLLADLVQPEQEVIVARGGRGGRGNTRFKSSSNRAPRMAEKGAPGEELWITLELKLLADVGLVGVPNAGKSTLLASLTNANPKIADYPFTTIQPNLGVLVYEHQDLVIADIPGLIEGAHMGIGLGHAFLRHIQRTRLLVHVVDGASDDPLADFNQINAELALYDEKLAQRPQIVLLNKIDLPQVRQKLKKLEESFAEHDVDVLPVSALSRDNLQSLIQRIFGEVAQLPDIVPQEVPAEETVTTYELDDEPIFTIHRNTAGAFVVKGTRIERAASMTYWDYEEAVNRFQKILETLGITDALKKAGVETGDTVFIGDYELEWTE
jgi:GTP-binding protein